MNKILIDTNIYSHALRGAPDIAEILRRVSEIGISVITIGELLSGFKGGDREKQNIDELHEFLDAPRVRLYRVDETTAEFYALIIDQLRQQGNPIPTNDVWIGSVALQHGLTLFTKDQHFQSIPGLLLVKADETVDS